LHDQPVRRATAPSVSPSSPPSMTSASAASSSARRRSPWCWPTPRVTRLLDIVQFQGKFITVQQVNDE
jgi:hypothetical protein